MLDGELSRFRKYFIYAGIAVGCCLGGWYLVRLHIQQTMPGRMIKTDPVWAQFVNVILIFFASIFQFSLLYKVFAWVMRMIGRKRRE